MEGAKDGMLRDKDYIRAAKGMLFNVTGYEHPSDAVFASLKYLKGEKWTHGYEAACEYLSGSAYVDSESGYIQVPHVCIERTYLPPQRWSELRMATELAPLHRESLDLGNILSEELGIPVESFGITDSLLWGDGHEQSDIDLVVVGLDYARQILQRGPAIYDRDEFERPDPNVMTAPYGMQIPTWPWLLGRKQHMGVFHGRLFSLRVVLDDHELPGEAAVVATQPFEAEESIEFQIADTSRSLLFPTIYGDSQGNELVDYSVVYEGVFREGEVVRCNAQRESMTSGKNRFTVCGICEIVSQSSAT